MDSRSVCMPRLGAVLLCIALLVGCSRADEREGGHADAPAKVPVFSVERVFAAVEQRWVDIPKVPVEGPVARPFFVESRTGKLRRFPCAECHSKDLAPLKARAPEGKRKTHVDIVRPHGNNADLTCLGCHSTRNAMEGLRQTDGRETGFDHSYRLCAQCHFQQHQAWKGGGHGKRLVGWAGQKLVRNCTGCHNPHDPLRPVSEVRWPAILPNAPIRGPHP